jgi:hypothetical protein
MSSKKVVKDQSADRPTRPFPTHREPVQCNVVEARGEANPGYTPDQTTRSHSEARDPEAIAQGATVPGEDGMSDSMRRAKAISKRRLETAATFQSLRKAHSITRKK